MKKHIVTIVLVALAATLGAWLYFDRDNLTADERKRRENNVFVGWKRDELTRIEIVRDGETLVLERDAKSDGSWHMAAPVAGRADHGAVEHLLAALEFATIARRAPEGENLGLDTPIVTGAIVRGNARVRFALGGPSPRPQGSSYFRVDTQAPIVVSKELVEVLLRPADAYRDRTVVPYLSIELARVTVAHGKTTYDVERIDDRNFRVVQAGVLASKRALDRHVWGAFAEMRAEAFPKETDVERLVATPRVTLTLNPKDASKPPAELVIGEACPGYPDDVVVVRRKPTPVAACAPKVIVEALSIDPASLVEKRPFAWNADEIEEIRFEAIPPGRALEVARKGTGFHARAPEDRDLTPDEADAATELLVRVARTEATSASKGEGKSFPAIARVRIRTVDEKEDVVEVAAPAGGRVSLTRVLDGALLDLSEADGLAFVPRDTSLRPRWLLGEKRKPTRLRLDCGVKQEFVDRGEGFRLVEPAGYETDGSVVEIVDAIVRGKIELWVADAPFAGAGVESDACSATVSFEEGAPRTLRLGNDTPDGVYGRVDGEPGIFVAPSVFRTLMKKIYVSRAFGFDPEKIESVRVTKNGRSIEQDRETLRDAVGVLHPDRVVAIGARAVAADAAKRTLVIEVAIAEGGAKRRISCTAEGTERTCVLEGTTAAFSLSAKKLAPFDPDPAPDAGEAAKLARDGGPR